MAISVKELIEQKEKIEGNRKKFCMISKHL